MVETERAKHRGNTQGLVVAEGECRRHVAVHALRPVSMRHWAIKDIQRCKTIEVAKSK